MPSKLLRASFWAIAGGASQYVAVFFLLIYLAHVLQPRDFGLMATVTVFLDLGMQIARWGQLELLQQQRYRNDEARNQSLRLSLAIAVVFAGLFVIGAGPLGHAYRSAQLTRMMYICAAVFPIYAVGSIAEAILRSEFRFRLLAFRNTVVTLIGSGVAIFLATRGFGPLTLAIQRLAQVSMAAVWVWTAVAWKPRVPRSCRVLLAPIPRGGVGDVRHRAAVDRSADGGSAGGLHARANLAGVDAGSLSDQRFRQPDVGAAAGPGRQCAIVWAQRRS